MNEVDTTKRKNDHIYYSLLYASQFSVKSSWLEYVELVHTPIPEIDLNDVTLEAEFLGYELKAPLAIAGMTGGTPLGKKLNVIFAKAAEELGVAIGVGSQRAALEKPSVAETFSVVKEYAPSVPKIANIGASQIAEGLDYDDLIRVIDMLDADALAVHLNPLQESLQLEGDARYSGFLSKLRDLVENSPVPVLVKETGTGISREAAQRLIELGVAGIDVGGAGGTSFARVEGLRSLSKGSRLLYELACDFSEWGIPTAASVLEVRSASSDIFVIATGGIRNGVDVAKALRIGANLCGLAYPLLKAAMLEGYAGVIRCLKRVIEGLRRAMFLTGARSLEELRRAPVVIRGALREWIEERGITVK